MPRSTSNTSMATMVTQPAWPWSVVVSIIQNMSDASPSGRPLITAVEAHSAATLASSAKVAAAMSSRRKAAKPVAPPESTQAAPALPRSARQHQRTNAEPTSQAKPRLSSSAEPTCNSATASTYFTVKVNSPLRRWPSRPAAAQPTV